MKKFYSCNHELIIELIYNEYLVDSIQRKELGINETAEELIFNLFMKDFYGKSKMYRTLRQSQNEIQKACEEIKKQRIKKG